MRIRIWTLGVTLLMVGCAPLSEAELADALDDAEAPAVHAQALSIRATPVELPSDDELPDCWWSPTEERCLRLCGDEPEEPRAPGRLTAKAAPVSSGALRRGVGDLIAAPDDGCDEPDGVLPCPHCRTHAQSQTRLGDFWVTNGLGSRVVIANGLGKFRIVDYPSLAPSGLFSMAEPPPWPNTHHVLLDLLQGGDELFSTAQTPHASQDLYLLFTFSGPAGELPSAVWMRCPAQGTDCTPFF